MRHTGRKASLDPAPYSWSATPNKQSISSRGANAGSYGDARAIISRQWPNNVVQITANFRSRRDILDHVNKCFVGPLSHRATWVCAAFGDD